MCTTGGHLLPTWIIEKLNEEQAERERQDRASWERQPRVGVDDSYRRPPVTTEPHWTPDHTREGGICEVDFSI